MIECPKCGKNLPDDMKYCGYCGSLLTEVSVNSPIPQKKKGINKAVLFSLAGVVIVGAVGIGVYLNSDSYKYSNAEKAYSEGNYAQAANILGNIKDYKDADRLYSVCMYENANELMSSGQYESAQSVLSQILDYEDSSELYDDCTHRIAIQNDITAPVISGMESGAVIEAKYEEEFNLMNYLHKTISVSDEVSGEITEYAVSTTSDVYDATTGKVDTEKAGTHEFTLSVRDEAGNGASLNFNIEIDNTIYITKENRTPVLCDNEEFGIYELNSIYYGSKNGEKGYIMEISIENNHTDNVHAYIGRCYINDYKVASYYWLDSIAPQKKGTMGCYIDKDDLDNDTTEFEYIEAEFIICEGGYWDTDNVIFERPVVIYQDAFE